MSLSRQGLDCCHCSLFFLHDYKAKFADEIVCKVAVEADNNVVGRDLAPASRIVVPVEAFREELLRVTVVKSKRQLRHVVVAAGLGYCAHDTLVRDVVQVFLISFLGREVGAGEAVREDELD